MPKDAATWERILAKQGRTLSAELAREREEVTAVKQAVASKLHLLLQYLRHPAPDFRVAVAIAFGCFPEVASRHLLELQTALQGEQDGHTRKVLAEVVGRVTYRGQLA